MVEANMSSRSTSADRLPAVATTLQLYIILGGILSLLGWILNFPRLTDWNGNGISIQPNSCVAVLLAGVGLTFLTLGVRQAVRVTGALLLAIGATALFEILAGVNLGIDTLLLFERNWGRTGIISPGRMGPAGALSWTLLGLAFLFASLSPPSTRRRYAPMLAQVTASIALLGLIGYLYGATTLYDRPHTTIIALQTATFIFAASIGVLINVPEYGLVSILRDPHAGGLFARRILPAIILVPILLGFFRLVGERAGLYDTAFGSAIRTVAEIILFMVLLWRISYALSSYAKHRIEAAEALKASRKELETELADSRRLQLLSTELIVEKDPNRLYESIVDAAVHIMRSDFASLQMLYPEEGKLRLLMHRGFSPEAAQFWEWVEAESGCSCGIALKTKERFIISDIEHSEAGSDHKSVYLDTGIRAVQSTPLVSRSGEIVGMISTHWRTPHEPLERELRLLDILARQAADLIERNRAEHEREELLQKERMARESAEHAARLKDDFLATLSHELRTPLHAVIGWAQILKKDLLEPDKARMAAEVIERNARLQAQLITDLLDISRIVSGNMRLDLQSVDLSGVVQAAIDSIMPAAEAKRVHIVTWIAPPKEPILGDPARLQQVVWNLLSNAVKFTPTDGTVRVALEPTNSHAEIRVEDTGEGIAPEFLPQLFKRFRQADPSPSRSHGGLGIGLAIVKQLVELHGGHIRADSKGLGKGATFTIELPVPARRKDLPRASIETPTEIAESSSLQGARVLLVDDEADALIMMRRILEDQGARVETALSVDTALDLLGSGTFDLLISDISMPERNGYDFIQAVRARNIDTPAVALTAFARAQDRARSLRSGYQAHASKPIEARELLRTLSSLLNERSPSVQH
ncbi:MAG TPA: ATP-binding protein [Dongiaceae bacterium]|nr:ATP-binding protein [Dongiaceae bacterium]